MKIQYGLARKSPVRRGTPFLCRRFDAVRVTFMYYGMDNP